MFSNFSEPPAAAVPAPASIQTLPPVVPSKAEEAPRPKFEVLSNRFVGFAEELAQTREKKKSEEQKAIKELDARLVTLNTNLQLESKNRAQGINALQAVSFLCGVLHAQCWCCTQWLTDKIEHWTIAIEAPMVTK